MTPEDIEALAGAVAELIRENTEPLRTRMAVLESRLDAQKEVLVFQIESAIQKALRTEDR